MKQLTEYNRVSGYLNKIYDKLNDAYFESALTRPIITIQSTPRAYGHVSILKIWKAGEEAKRQLNIGAGTINRPIEEIVSTMLHEMVHIYCMDNKIQDTSRNGAYHNKKFRDEAEKRDLTIAHHNTYGWTITTPTDKLVEWCIENELEEIRVNRIDPFGIAPPTTGKAGNESGSRPRKPSSTIKYICPKCGATVRATKNMDEMIICAPCQIAYGRA
jgi:hypothetical protein